MICRYVTSCTRFAEETGIYSRAFAILHTHPRNSVHMHIDARTHGCCWLRRRGTPAGLGNQHDLVGRFFMVHLDVRSAYFVMPFAAPIKMSSMSLWR